jgi:transcriptional regulator with XRE-family HTH domain
LGLKLARTKEWRESHGLTQRELAAEAGVGEVTVARIEAGASVAPPTARKIAEALGVTVADLLERPPVPLAEAPQTGLNAPTQEGPLMSRPEIREWLREFGHTSEEEFLAWASDLDLDLDEKGFPCGIERAKHELKQRRDRILDALRDPDVQADLFGRAQTEGLTGDDWAREVFRPSKAARKLTNEVRQEFTRREVSLVNYSVRLFVEGVTDNYLAYDRSREYLDRRHQELLKLRTRALEEGSRRSQAHTKREMHHWLDEAYGAA